MERESRPRARPGYIPLRESIDPVQTDTVTSLIRPKDIHCWLFDTPTRGEGEVS
jgi:hypothetical protein